MPTSPCWSWIQNNTGQKSTALNSHLTCTVCLMPHLREHTVAQGENTIKCHGQDWRHQPCVGVRWMPKTVGKLFSHQWRKCQKWQVKVVGTKQDSVGILHLKLPWSLSSQYTTPSIAEPRPTQSLKQRPWPSTWLLCIGLRLACLPYDVS